MPGSCASDSVTTFASRSGSATRIIATKSHSPVTDQASETPSISASCPPSVWSASRSARIKTTACVTSGRIRRSGSPGTDAAHAADLDPQAHARRWIVHRRETHVRTQVDVGELLEQFGGAALLDRCCAVHDGVLEQSRRLDLAALERHGHARVTCNVLDLLQARVEVSGEQVVAVDPDPDAGHLRAAVGIRRHEMAKRTAADQILDAVVQH